MSLRLAADAVALLHLAFVLFVAFGGLLVWRWPRLAWLHLPAVGWGGWIEFAGWTCPLTPLENALRRAVGKAGYAGGFIDHYLWPPPDPAGSTRERRERASRSKSPSVIKLNNLVRSSSSTHHGTRCG